jgi:hypothetical protein
VTARVTAIACGHEDAIDHNDLRHDPLMKVAVGRCPESGAPLGSQSTISRLENAPSKTDAARLTVALVDQFGTTVTPGRIEMFAIKLHKAQLASDRMSCHSAIANQVRLVFPTQRHIAYPVQAAQARHFRIVLLSTNRRRRSHQSEWCSKARHR